MRTKKLTKIMAQELMAASVGGKIKKLKMANKNTLIVKFYDGSKFDIEIHKYDINTTTVTK